MSMLPGSVQGSEGAPEEASLYMVPRGELFLFSIYFSNGLRRETVPVKTKEFKT
jgi:hypothetical protein